MDIVGHYYIIIIILQINLVVDDMDWSKAKNILILAFIVTNMFLFYHLSRDLLVGGDLNIISDQYISNVETHLKENGIFLETDIPKEIISLPVYLTVKYQQYNPNEVAKQFLRENYKLADEGVNKLDINEVVYQKGDEKLIVESSKRIQYYNFNKGRATSLSEKDAISKSIEFLAQVGFDDSDVLLNQIHHNYYNEILDEHLYKLIYNQTFNNRFLGESHIHVYVNDNGVVGFESMLLEVEKVNNEKKVLIPATHALLRKMSEIVDDNKGNRVVVDRIEMGYYFNPHDFDFVTNWHTIETGRAFPAWKITLTNGRTYYVEALKN